MRLAASILISLLYLGVIAGYVYAGVLELELDKLDLTPLSAIVLVAAAWLASWLDLPLFRIRGPALAAGDQSPLARYLLRDYPPLAGKTRVHINLGGALLPVGFSLYLAATHPLPLATLIIATAVVAAISLLTAEIIHGIGLGVPLLVLAVVAACTGQALGAAAAEPLAFICGTLGTLIGADLLRLHEVRKTGLFEVSIGGAGILDGVFLIGPLAVLFS